MWHYPDFIVRLVFRQEPRDQDTIKSRIDSDRVFISDLIVRLILLDDTMTTRLRICLLTPEFPPHRVGGIGAYIATLAAGLGAAGMPSMSSAATSTRNPEPSITPGGAASAWRRRRTRFNGPFARAVAGCLHWLAHKKARPCGASTRISNTAADRIGARPPRFVRRTTHRYDIVEYPNWPGDAGLIPRRRGTVVRLSTSVADINPGSSWVPLAAGEAGP